MQVIVESPDPQAAEMREFAERRVRFSMRRLSWLVPRVKVHLSDVNGPRGGVDKRCQVQLVADGRPDVVVTSVARDWRSALQSALGRAVRSLLHNWQRSHKLPRARPAVITHQT